MAVVCEPRRQFEHVERTAAGLSFDGELLPWAAIVRVACVIDWGPFATCDTDWLVVEDDRGRFAWIAARGWNDVIDALLRPSLPVQGPVSPLGRWHESGPAGINLATVIWPAAQHGQPMFCEVARGIWPFRRVRLVALPRSGAGA